jgi:hypothetical protein
MTLYIIGMQVMCGFLIGVSERDLDTWKGAFMLVVLALIWPITMGYIVASELKVREERTMKE